MNFVLSLQQSDEHVATDDLRSCNIASLASCFVCSISTASVAVCLTL
ncbi:MAG: hypothetical protein ABWX96_09175 [Propionibacteriaceae bacterium]